MADRKQTPDILGGLLGGGPLPTPAAEAPSGGDSLADDPSTVDSAAQAPGAALNRPARQHNGKTESHNTIKTEKRNDVKPARPKAVKPEEPDSAAETTSGKVKATFYIGEDAVNALDDAHYRLRRMARPENRGSISKSLIVEEALKIVIEELESKGDTSRIASRTVGQKNRKP